MVTTPDIFTAAVLVVGIAVWLRCMIQGTKEFNQHKAAHHHINMMNEEVARRWREQQLAQADNQ